MNGLRHPVFQRTVALLLFAGASVACIPGATAAATVEAAFESELRAKLGDSEAIELAIQAARHAPTPEAAVEAFIEVYISATGDVEAARDIARLLHDHPNQFGAPALPPNRAVWTVASSTAQLTHRSACSALVLEGPVSRIALLGIVASSETAAALLSRPHRTQQPRGP